MSSIDCYEASPLFLLLPFTSFRDSNALATWLYCGQAAASSPCSNELPIIASLHSGARQQQFIWSSAQSAAFLSSSYIYDLFCISFPLNQKTITFLYIFREKINNIILLLLTDWFNNLSYVWHQDLVNTFF